MRYAIDPSKIAKDLGWYPETDFETGIRKTVKWYLENQEWVNEVASGDYQKYYEEMYGNKWKMSSFFLTKSYIKHTTNTSDKLNFKRGEQNPYNSLRDIVFLYIRRLIKVICQIVLIKKFRLWLDRIKRIFEN